MRSRLVKGVTLGVRGLVTHPEHGGVLLVRHSYLPGWYLPGGGVEPRETAVRSLARELEEEAALALDGEPELLGLYFNEGARMRDHIALYRVTEWRQARPFRPNAEILEARFFPLDALPEGTTASTLRRLDEHLRGAPVSTVW
jgi:ADP-ribose pyrophosphatase YjhB (NUDIX family)